jgi:hypothetical protein
MDRSFEEAARLIAESSEASDEELVLSLTRAGWPPTEADLAVSFLPIAFGRLALRELGVSEYADRFEAKNAKGKWVAYRLSANPVFRAAARLAAAATVHGALTPEQFKAIAARSSEIHAASKALDAGSSVAGGRVGPVLLLGTRAEDLGSRGKLRWWQRSLLRR